MDARCRLLLFLLFATRGAHTLCKSRDDHTHESWVTFLHYIGKPQRQLLGHRLAKSEERTEAVNVLLSQSQNFEERGDLASAAFFLARAVEESNIHIRREELGFSLHKLNEKRQALQKALEKNCNQGRCDLDIFALQERINSLLMEGNMKHACKALRGAQNYLENYLGSIQGAGLGLLRGLEACGMYRELLLVASRHEQEIFENPDLFGYTGAAYDFLCRENRNNRALHLQQRRHWSRSGYTMSPRPEYESDDATFVKKWMLRFALISRATARMARIGFSDENLTLNPSYGRSPKKSTAQHLTPGKGTGSVGVCKDCEPTHFIRKYLRPQKPAIIEGAIPVEAFQGVRSQFDYENILSRWGNLTVYVSNSYDIVPRQYVGPRNSGWAMGVFQTAMTVKNALKVFARRNRAGQHAENDSVRFDAVPYAFTYVHRMCDGLDIATCRPPSAKDIMNFLEHFAPNSRGQFCNEEEDTSCIEGRWNSTFLSLGTTGSGVYWHAHGTTFSLGIHGRKKWFLYPPGAYYGPVIGNFQWWQKYVRSELKVQPLEFIQHPGQIVFVPSQWAHMTLCLDDVVSLTVQTDRSIA